MRKKTLCYRENVQQSRNLPLISYHQVRVAALYEEVEGVLVRCKCELIISGRHPIQALDCHRPEVPCELRTCMIGEHRCASCNKGVYERHFLVLGLILKRRLCISAFYRDQGLHPRKYSSFREVRSLSFLKADVSALDGLASHYCTALFTLNLRHKIP